MLEPFLPATMEGVLAVTATLAYVLYWGWGLWEWGRFLAPLRRRIRRRPPPRKLDMVSWIHLATVFGAKCPSSEHPRITGRNEGIPFRLEYTTVSGARTIASARLPRPLRVPLEVRPYGAGDTTGGKPMTGDPEFDEMFHVLCVNRAVRNRVLTASVRQWILAVQPLAVRVRGKRISAEVKGFVSDPDILRGLVELVVSAVRGKSG